MLNQIMNVGLGLRFRGDSHVDVVRPNIVSFKTIIRLGWHKQAGRLLRGCRAIPKIPHDCAPISTY